MKSRCMRGIVFVLTTSAALVGTPRWSAAQGSPPALRLWPSATVATFRLPEKQAPEQFIAADLDGKAGDELVTVAFVPNSSGGVAEQAGKQFTVHQWRGGFQRLTQKRLPVTWRVTAGDVDRNGADELYAIDTNNALLTVRLQNGRLQVTHRQLLTRGMVGSIAVSNVRQSAIPELLVAVDTRQKFDSDGEPNCNLLVGYRWSNAKWTKAWQQNISQKETTLDLKTGAYSGAGRRDLVFEHGPTDVSVSHFEAWQWDGTRLVKRATATGDAGATTGLQTWLGMTAPAPSGVGYIVSKTIYLTQTPTGEEHTVRGELLRWGANRVQKAFRLPGRPVAVGRFTRADREAILVALPAGAYSLLEGRR